MTMQYALLFNVYTVRYNIYFGLLNTLTVGKQSVFMIYAFQLVGSFLRLQTEVDELYMIYFAALT